MTGPFDGSAGGGTGSVHRAWVQTWGLAGWATVSAAPIAVPTMWFGLFEWPHLPILSTLPRAQKIVIDPSLQATHAILAFSWMALVALHIAAALKHHFKDRDQVLKHMLP